jgi:hypothetical protein
MSRDGEDSRLGLLHDLLMAYEVRFSSIGILAGLSPAVKLG